MGGGWIGFGFGFGFSVSIGFGLGFAGRTDADAGQHASHLVCHAAEEVVRRAAVAAERVADVFGHELRRLVPRPLVRLALDLHRHVHDALQLHAG